jgi:polysaccharide biosynthesis protein PslG
MSVALALLVAVAAAGPAQAAKRSVPFGFFGTVLDPVAGDPASVSNQALDSQLGLMARSGVESLRVTFGWDQVEPAAGRFNFAATDRLAADSARHGIALLANLVYTPMWASSHPSGLYPFRYAPTSPQLFATFAQALVQRYGPHGTFWRLNRGLPADPIREWQIWNEQAFDVFWATLPWAPNYTRLLRAAYTSIHRADHGAKVVAGSLVATNRYTQWAQMSDLYKAGAKRSFDVVAVHPFTDGSIPVSQSVSRVVTIVTKVRNVMRSHGDARKPIILTEMTWPGAVGFVKRSRLLGLETTPHGEILRLQAVYKYLATHRQQTGVSQAYWYTWASTFNANDPQSDVGYRFAGLTRFSNGAFTVQPVLHSYARSAAQYEGCKKSSNAHKCG